MRFYIVSEYLTTLIVTWKELNNQRPILQFNCDLAKYTKEDMVITFLTGLGD